jgi:hypothetical protein
VHRPVGQLLNLSPRSLHFILLLQIRPRRSEIPSNTMDRSGTSTPSNEAHSSRFTSQQATAEDLLKSQTVGLVQLSDFRKRRAEALELKQGSGTSTPATG